MSENYTVRNGRKWKQDSRLSKRLKPCPFCGEEVYLTDGGSFQSPAYAVRCSKCCLEFAYHPVRGGIFPTAEKAMQAWNRRAKIA